MVINTPQKSSNMLDLSTSLSVSLKWSLIQTFNKGNHVHTWLEERIALLPHLHLHVHQQILHVLHMHTSCTCLTSSTGSRKAIHEQQALLTTLAPLH